MNKKINLTIYLLLLFISNAFCFSFTTDYESTLEEITSNIQADNLNIARKLTKEALNNYGATNELVHNYLAVCFKLHKYDQTFRTGKIIMTKNHLDYDQILNNDIFYFFIYSAIEIGEFSTADFFLKKVGKFDFKDTEAKFKIALLQIRYAYKTFKKTDKEIFVEQVNSLLKTYNPNDDIKLNLYYTLADVFAKAEEYDRTLEIAERVIALDQKGIYHEKLYNLFDRIVYLGESNFFENYSEVLTRLYDDLYNKIESKNVKFQIKRKLNSLLNRKVEVENIVATSENQLTALKILADDKVTRIVLGANDKFDYTYKYDGKELKLTLKDKSIKARKNSLDPVAGSGIEYLNWQKDGNNLSFKIGLSDDYEMSFEELNDTFEKNKKVADQNQLILNIHLPEDYTEDIISDRYEKKYTIVLDPGHGGDDYGAMGVKRKQNGSRYSEKEVALLLCKKLKKFLENYGYRIFLTRNADYYPDLNERNRIAQNRNADMFISLHLNSANRRYRKFWQNDRYIGTEMVVRKSLGHQPKFVNSKEITRNQWLKRRRVALREHKKLSSILAETVPSFMRKPFNTRRTIKYRNLAIFSGTVIPHALIEAGFIINNKNLEYLLSDYGQQSLFKGILSGIERYRKSSTVYAKK